MEKRDQNYQKKAKTKEENQRKRKKEKRKEEEEEKKKHIVNRKRQNLCERWTNLSSFLPDLGRKHIVGHMKKILEPH